jgi:hypothetical protein
MTSGHRCNRKGCASEGLVRPVLVLSAGPVTPPIRAALGLLVCKAHETPIAETYVNVVVTWESLCAQYVEAWKRAILLGAAPRDDIVPPVPELTRVEYVAHDGAESRAFEETWERLHGGKVPAVQVEDAGGVRSVPLIRGGN